MSMNWITTNLRLPEDIYMDLKMQAARERKSVAAVIREKLSSNQQGKSQDLLQSIKNFGRKIAKKQKGLNLTKAVIEMRYEQ